MPVIYCSVDSCASRRGNGLAFFRCPKDKVRCQVWKDQLGFTGTHRYATIGSDQGYERIRICSKHFTDESFTTPEKHRLHYNAKPTLFLSAPTSSSRVSDDTKTTLPPKFQDVEIQTDAPNQNDACVQTNTCITIKRGSNGVSDDNSKTMVPPKFQDVEIQTGAPIQNDACVQTETRIPIKRERSCQTSEKLLASGPREAALRRNIKALEKEVSHANERLEAGVTLNDVEKFMTDNYSEQSSGFLKAQLSLLNKAPKSCRYTDEFKLYCLSLYFMGPKAYKKLVNVCRMPSKSTLQRFIKSWETTPGFNDLIFRLIDIRSRLLQDKDKDCVLCIDETPIKSNLYYDISKDKLIGFQEGFNSKSSDIASKALVLMARGVANDWKVPVAYFFYKTLTSDEVKEILFKSIRKLNGTGLHVLAVVSDQGSNFVKLVTTSLKLTESNPCFMVDGQELVYIFDVPHLLKSTRNNFFIYKFIFNEGETNKNFLEQMYHFDNQKQYRLAPKLTNEHIFPNCIQKRKVKLATEVFSRPVAVALSTYIDFKVLPEEAKPTVDFIKKMDTFFDIFNSNSSDNSGAFTGTEKQISILKEMDDLFKDLRVENFNGKNVTKRLKFIFGWRVTIKSILVLFNKLQAKGHKKMFIRNLDNQDCLENFFVQIRTCCGTVRSPTPIQFCRSFKKLFKLKYFDQTDSGNCMEDVNEVLLKMTSNNIVENASRRLIVPKPTYSPLKIYSTDYRNLETPGGNSLLYITRYFLSKCLLQHSCKICTDFSNSSTLSATEATFCYIKSYCSTTSGELVVPFRNILEFVLALEDIFVSKFEKLVRRENIGKSLKHHFADITFNHPCKNFPLEYFVTVYTRVRIYFTLKFANQIIKTGRANKVNTKLSILQHL